jgi:3'-phosphoadenosine 5'-phosphosulfate sulfotransferase (PAPS reductase)/FAD synthetase
MNPFLIEGPFVISFSGGRTSGLMLYKILEAHGGKMPEQSRVVFCNTGKEREETLRFVERCSLEWGVEITWLEYRWHKFSTPKVHEYKNGNTRDVRGEHRFEIVNYATASRNGEPLEQAIIARQYLPNVIARFCTVECKIRTTQRYLKSLGWVKWRACIGMRADEPKRVERLLTTNRHNNEIPFAPLDEAGLELADVRKFWRESPFDLQLEQHEGNCDLCFLKGKGKILRILKERPDLADWWIRMEDLSFGRRIDDTRFRRDRPSYRGLLAESKQPGLFDELECDELSEACHCTD